MGFVKEQKEKVLGGEQITKEEAMRLYEEPLEEVCTAADEIRRYFCEDRFDLCTIINGKSGKCPEDCKYCAQSAYYQTSTEDYPLLETEEIVRQAKYNADRGVLRYSIVTSGRALKDEEIDQMCGAIRAIREQTDIEVCVSFGLLSEAQFRRVKEAGASRVHNNLETSRRNFPNVCTTHTFDDKVEAVKAAKSAGHKVCSRGRRGGGGEGGVGAPPT
ncbi:MAG: biotin synthase BioB [Lachnospiraceae bacterium]|nr:biotin synthase BioB [Lachnospiraceae bacterium]